MSASTTTRHYRIDRGFGSAWHVRDGRTGRLFGPPRSKREARQAARELNGSVRRLTIVR